MAPYTSSALRDPLTLHCGPTDTTGQTCRKRQAAAATGDWANIARIFVYATSLVKGTAGGNMHLAHVTYVSAMHTRQDGTEVAERQ